MAKIMREKRLRVEIAYKRRHMKAGKLETIAGNILDRNFSPDMPNQAWVSDSTYARTYEDFLSVATVLDLSFRRIVGWSMDEKIDWHLVIRDPMIAVWKRQPRATVLVHSDQGSQYSKADYVACLRTKNLKPLMSHRGNYYENAIAESFFSTSKNA